MRVPPGSTVRILDAEAGRAPKGGEGSYFRSEGRGEGPFRGAKAPPNSYRFRGRFGPGSDFGSGFGAYPGAPPTVGRGSEPGTDCPTCLRYRGEGGRNEHRPYPPFSPPWGRAPTVPQVHLSTEKAAIPFPTFPIVEDVPVHPAAHRARWCIPPGCRLGPRPLSRRAAATVSSRYNASRNPPRAPGSRSEAAAGPQNQEGLSDLQRVCESSYKSKEWCDARVHDYRRRIQ